MENPFLPDYSDAQNTISSASDRFSPYYNAGTRALKGTQIADANMMLHPAALENRIMRGYTMSPHAQYQTDTLNNEMNNQAAAAGDLGTPDAQVALANQTQGIVSADQNQYLQDAMTQYKMGFNNLSHISDQGMGAAQAMARQDDINARLEAERANADSSMWSSALGAGIQGVGAVAGALL